MTILVKVQSVTPQEWGISVYAAVETTVGTYTGAYCLELPETAEHSEIESAISALYAGCGSQ